jgi:hypothetical protein
VTVSGGIVEFGLSSPRTYTATATITADPTNGGQLVELTGNRTIGPAGAASTKTVGVALQSCASGDVIAVATRGVWPMKASGAIAAGDTLVAAAAGAVSTAGATPDARTVIGRAEEAISSGAVGRVRLILG